MKKQTNIRMSDATRKKLDALAVHYGTQAEAVAVAIDRLYREEVNQMSDLREQAQRRVDSDPRLVAHESVIMYDWAEGDEHWQWVISAPVAEIVGWAETVEKE